MAMAGTFWTSKMLGLRVDGDLSQQMRRNGKQTDPGIHASGQKDFNDEISCESNIVFPEARVYNE